MRTYSERAWWPDIGTAIENFRRGEERAFSHALARYACLPKAGPGATALDACCGSGQGSALLQDKGYSVSAFDRHPAAKDFLMNQGIEFAEKDLYEISLFPLKFDLVVCSDALEHLTDTAKALTRLGRWTAPGGSLYLTVPIEGENSPNPYHVQSWTRDGFMSLLDGWAVERDYAPAGPQVWLFLSRRTQ